MGLKPHSYGVRTLQDGEGTREALLLVHVGTVDIHLPP